VASTKQMVRSVLDGLPDDCTLEDVQYQLYVRQKIANSRQAVAEGRVVSHDDVKQRLAKWAEK
jgi:hypothetical protein